MGVIACSIVLAYFDFPVVRVIGFLGMAVSLFWYVVPGYAMIYGPHLFLLAIAELFRRPDHNDDE
jgi:hypothetical protein